MALLPVADLSANNTAWNRDMQRDLNASLRARGYDMVDPAEVLAAVRAMRLRDLGEAGSYACRQLGERLGCEYILSATVVEAGEGNAPVLGLLLQLFHAQSGAPVWGRTFSGAGAEQPGLLGLQGDMDDEQLRRQGIRALVDAFEHIQFGRLHLPAAGVPPDYAIEVVDFMQTLLRCGAPLKCRLKVRTDAAADTILKLALADDVVVLRPTPQQDVYEAVLRAPAQPGRYSIAMLEIDARGRERKVNTVAEIETVCQAPQLVLESSAKAGEHADAPAFSGRLVVRPRLEDKRQIDHWSFRITDSQNRRVLEQTRNGNLPAAVYWSGIDARRYPLPSGHYNVTLQVHDAAGFSSSASTEVYLQQPQDEFATIEALTRDGDTVLMLRGREHGGTIPSTWKVYVTDKDENLVFKRSGSAMPTEIRLPDEIVQGRELYCQVYVRDNMGNRYWTDTAPVEQYIAADKGTETHERKLAWNTAF